MPSAALTVQDQNGLVLFQHTIAFNAGDTVQTVLENAVNAYSPAKITFGLQYYGVFQNPPLGYFVNMFNGVYDAPDAGVYWAFSYNGVLANTGIDFIEPEQGDTILFAQTAYDAGRHRATHLGIKHRHHRAK
jgi:hypothetical protein